MRIVGKIALYMVAVAVAGCLLAPPLYWLGRYLVETDLLPQLKPFRFPKYFNRAMLVVVLASLWPFLRWLGVRHWTDLGLKPNPVRFRDLALGLAIGAGGLALVGLMLVVGGAAKLRQSMPWDALWPIALTAAIVPLIEEPFFRGALLGMLRRTLPWPQALAFLSFFFAILHFIKPPPGRPPAGEITWTAGFELLPKVFWQFGDIDLVLGGWVTLFLVGFILGYSVVRTQSLYMALGLHAGWIYALRSFAKITKRTAPESFWVGEDITTGLVPVLMLLATLLAVHWLLKRRQQNAVAS